jgi:hypothetical protein
MSRYRLIVSPETLELLDAIIERMVSLFSISTAKAVARINEQWSGQDLSSDDEIILHEDDYYWALFIFFGGNVPDWNPQADRSAWPRKPAPSMDSGHWPTGGMGGEPVRGTPSGL